MIRINKKLLEEITDVNNERNIYVHPLALARDIFWQRLEYAFKYIEKYTNINDNILDFGGGSGVFARTLSTYFNEVSIIDLDTQDAVSIKKYFELDNLNIITEDINTFTSIEKFNVIVATDVLEHFKDLGQPLNFFNKFLLKDGFLLVTLPTENKLYEFGRLIINKSKPSDHYHTSEEVLDFFINNRFKLIEKKFLPRYIVPIPLFEVAILQFKGNSYE